MLHWTKNKRKLLIHLLDQECCSVINNGGEYLIEVKKVQVLFIFTCRRIYKIEFRRSEKLCDKTEGSFINDQCVLSVRSAFTVISRSPYWTRGVPRRSLEPLPIQGAPLNFRFTPPPHHHHQHHPITFPY